MVIVEKVRLQLEISTCIISEFLRTWWLQLNFHVFLRLLLFGNGWIKFYVVASIVNSWCTKNKNNFIIVSRQFFIQKGNFFCIFLVFQYIVSLCSPCLPETHSAYQDSLEHRDLLASASSVLGSKVFTTTTWQLLLQFCIWQLHNKI